jgi:hypothetical protein
MKQNSKIYPSHANFLIIEINSSNVLTGTLAQKTDIDKYI